MSGEVFAEHRRVRVTIDREVEGYHVTRDMVGTVVSVYGGGEAYAVEFENLQGEMAVVTLNAADLERVSG